MAALDASQAPPHRYQDNPDNPQGTEMTLIMDRRTVTIPDIRGLATVNVDVAAAFIGLSRNAMYAAVKAGEIKALKLGRRILIPVVPLLALVSATDEEAGK